MVTHKNRGDKLAEPDGKETGFKNNKLAIGIGAGVLAVLSVLGVKELTQSPEDKLVEAVSELVDEQSKTQTTIPVTTTTRLVVVDPDAPPATNVERPDVTVPPPTAPELSPEQQLLVELAPTFSEIVNAGPASPYDIALKVEDFPAPGDTPAAIIEADMRSMSLILTHSYGNPDIIHALIKDVPANPYPGIDAIFADAENIGRFRFPPENDPEYSEDKPNFGAFYRASNLEDLEVFYRDGGNTVVIQRFPIELIYFNYDEEQGGWYLSLQKLLTERAARTYQRNTIPLENDAGEVVMTEIWQLAPPRQLN